MGHALITGASAGLGLDFARIFAQAGHNLTLVARRKDRLEKLAAELRSLRVTVHVLEADLSEPGAGRMIFAKVSSEIDFLVNNAGVGTGGAFARLPLAKELQMIDLNVRTLVELTHLFLPGMIARGRGRILNVGSTAGFQPGPYMATYYATKAFVNSWSEALSDELPGTGVTCTVLAPGPTHTEFAQVAGITKSTLFRSSAIAASADVARYGYRRMMKGRGMSIFGWSNKLLVMSLRLAPRSVIRKIAGKLNRSKT